MPSNRVGHEDPRLNPRKDWNSNVIVRRFSFFSAGVACPREKPQSALAAAVQVCKTRRPRARVRSGWCRSGDRALRGPCPLLRAAPHLDHVAPSHPGLWACPGEKTLCFCAKGLGVTVLGHLQCPLSPTPAWGSPSCACLVADSALPCASASAGAARVLPCPCQPLPPLPSHPSFPHKRTGIFLVSGP